MTAPGPSWLSVFSAEDRASFFAKMKDALDTSAARMDTGPLEACLREWKTTARALAQPGMREALERDRFRDEDFAGVSRPGGTTE